MHWPPPSFLICFILLSCNRTASEQKQLLLKMEALSIPSTGYINFKLINQTDQDLSFSVEGLVKDASWHSFNYNLLSVEHWKPKNAEEAHLTINYRLNKKTERSFSIPASVFPNNSGLNNDSFQLRVYYFSGDSREMSIKNGPTFSIYSKNSN